MNEQDPDFVTDIKDRLIDRLGHFSDPLLRDAIAVLSQLVADVKEARGLTAMLDFQLSLFEENDYGFPREHVVMARELVEGTMRRWLAEGASPVAPAPEIHLCGNKQCCAICGTHSIPHVGCILR